MFYDTKELIQGKKQYQYNQYVKYFNQKTDLIQHQRAYTGEKLYQCHQCDKYSTLKGNLVEHYRLHTGESISI